MSGLKILKLLLYIITIAYVWVIVFNNQCFMRKKNKLLFVLAFVSIVQRHGYCQSNSGFRAMCFGGEVSWNKGYGGVLYMGFEKPHFEYRSLELVFFSPSSDRGPMIGVSQSIRYVINQKTRFQPYLGITPGIYRFNESGSDYNSGWGVGLSPHAGLRVFISPKVSISGSLKYLFLTSNRSQLLFESGLRFNIKNTMP